MILNSVDIRVTILAPGLVLVKEIEDNEEDQKVWKCPECYPKIEYNEVKPYHNKTILEHLYFDHTFSLQRLANLYSVSVSSITWHMNKHGLERRPR